MKTTLYTILFLLTLVTNSFSQGSTSTINLAIGRIIDAGATGIPLPDGNRVYAKKIKTGEGNTEYSRFGEWNHNPADLGGPLNGINDPDNFTPGTVALTRDAYTGNKAPENFTKIVNSAGGIDDGIDKNLKNSIGIRLWFDFPIPDAKFLFVDIDGSNEFKGNREWITSFAYNGNTRVLPSIIDIGNSLNNSNERKVNNTWNSLIDTEQGVSADNFTETGSGSGNPDIIVRKSDLGSSPVDPDNVNAQVYFGYNASINNFYILWGILEDATNSNEQNSGMSPFAFTISSDFGDAPDSYGTKYLSNGASHGIFADLHLGVSETDSESGDNAGVDANADDNTMDDEDGITDGTNSNLAPPMMPNTKTTTSEVIASYSVQVIGVNNLASDSKLIGWIDWNNNGMFEADEASDVQTLPASSGQVTYTLSWAGKTLVHPSDFKGYTYLRLRTTTDSNFGIDTPAGAMKDGEVEDYKLIYAIPTAFTDYGDAPESYGNPSNKVVEDFRLGALIDSEMISAYSNNSDGDDGADSDDEDGVATIPAIEYNVTTGPTTIENYTIGVDVLNNREAAKVAAWIDWNRNGTFDSDELTTTAVPVSAASQSISLIWPTLNLEYVNRPVLYMRVRLLPATETPDPTVEYTSGEVEDYTIEYRLNTAFPVTLSQFGYEYQENDKVLLKWQTTEESLSDGFELQRAIDAVHYEKVVFVKGNGTTLNHSTYSYLDSPKVSVSPTWYYRLKMIDIDGSYSYSRAVNVRFKDKGINSLLAKPTIVESGENVVIDGIDTINTVKLYSISGRLITEKRFDGSRSVSLQIPKLSSGMYLIHVNDTRTIKIIVR